MMDDSVEHASGHEPETELVARVQVQAPGVSIDREVDELTMSQVIALLFGAAPHQPVGGVRGSHTDSGGARGGAEVGSSRVTESEWDTRMTLGEFLDETGAKTFPHKICATGYYLTEIKGAEGFSRDEVKAALLNAKEDMPANYARDWTTATTLSLIASEGSESSRFYIPRTGKNAIKSKFQDAPKPRRSRKSPKKASSSGDAE